ncbi:MAG: FAD-dependent oxidoreductase [Eubacteriales bacterium]|nr:FAD-dependent oxidoreductase [Eubacteriales bacterium]
MSEVTLKTERLSVAQIDGYHCVNCGTCEEYCPANAISERQKTVCHLCPDCTEMKALNVSEMEEMRTESCTLACPLGISPQGYINLLKAGKEKEAYELILDKNPLPSICGSICHHPCEEMCKRGKLVDKPMKIRGLKRYLGEKYLDTPLKKYPVLYQEEVAVIGAGPAGLTAAHTLAKKGYPVTVFEEASEAGGMLLRAIPDFRLDKNTAVKEIARLEEAGIRFEFGSKVRPSDIRKDFDKIIVATGNSVSKGLPIPNSVCKGVTTALDFMSKVNGGMDVKLHGNVVVIGGGSVAMDTARAAIRLGAEHVTVLCLESAASMPAHPWEVEEAKEEGIEILTSVSPVKFAAYEDAAPHRLTGVLYTKIENLDLKTLSFDRVGEEINLAADFAIIATGQKPQPQYLSDEDVILAGDVAGGPCSVIDAMASGRKAALLADVQLRGRETKEYQVERQVSEGDPKYRVYPATRMKLDFPETVKIHDVSSFEVTEQCLTDDEALLETYRCLQCGYREVDPSKCLGCGVCSKVCPKGDVIRFVSVEEKEV